MATKPPKECELIDRILSSASDAKEEPRLDQLRLDLIQLAPHAPFVRDQDGVLHAGFDAACALIGTPKTFMSLSNLQFIVCCISEILSPHLQQITQHNNLGDRSNDFLVTAALRCVGDSTSLPSRPSSEFIHEFLSLVQLNESTEDVESVRWGARLCAGQGLFEAVRNGMCHSQFIYDSKTNTVVLWTSPTPEEVKGVILTSLPFLEDFFITASKAFHYLSQHSATANFGECSNSLCVRLGDKEFFGVRAVNALLSSNSCDLFHLITMSTLFEETAMRAITVPVMQSAISKAQDSLTLSPGGQLQVAVGQLLVQLMRRFDSVLLAQEQKQHARVSELDAQEEKLRTEQRYVEEQKRRTSKERLAANHPLVEQMIRLRKEKTEIQSTRSQLKKSLQDLRASHLPLEVRMKDDSVRRAAASALNVSHHLQNKDLPLSPEAAMRMCAINFCFRVSAVIPVNKMLAVEFSEGHPSLLQGLFDRDVIAQFRHAMCHLNVRCEIDSGGLRRDSLIRAWNRRDQVRGPEMVLQRSEVPSHLQALTNALSDLNVCHKGHRLPMLLAQIMERDLVFYGSVQEAFKRV